MVKVLIDGKEFEGKQVSVFEYKKALSNCNYEGIHFVGDNIEFVSVPKEIQFVSIENYIGLKFSDSQVLSKSLSRWEVRDYTIKNFNMVDCILVPCNREDLKAGDFFVGSRNSSFEKEKLTNLYCYNLVVGDSADKYMNCYRDERHYSLTASIQEYNSDVNNYLFFWRVVPRSEVEKQ